MKTNRFRAIPQLQKLLETEAGKNLCEQYSRQETINTLRTRLDSIREQLSEDKETNLPDFLSPEFFAGVRDEILRNREPSLSEVINTTGIVLHTNLGRAPLPRETIDAIKRIAVSYSNLEMDLKSGKRGSRYSHVETVLKKLTGAEAAIVVNNCAAAVLVTLNTLAKNSEMIVSRGELIEIGGGFRMPDVIAASGARLVEVGTTNKTRLSDYREAITEQSKVVLRNHCSNYRVIGFTENPVLEELVELAHSNHLLMVEDLGSGAFVDLAGNGIHNEPTVRQLIRAGVDIVMFSGDKLLGGPQAGIIVGRLEPVAAIKKNPLLRALRIDKLSLAALEATLHLYLDPDLARQRIPILNMLSQDKATITRRSKNLLNQLKKIDELEAWLEDDVSYVGGGSAPMNELPTSVIKLRSEKYSAEQIATRLRQFRPAIIGRISDNAFVIDLRTVFPAQVKTLLEALQTTVQ